MSQPRNYRPWLSILAWFLGGWLIVVLISETAWAADQKDVVPPEIRKDVQELLTSVSAAIKTGNYESLRTKNKKRSGVKWKTSYPATEENSDLQLGEIVKKLNTLAEHSILEVSRDITWFADLITIETKGWAGGSLFVFWTFQLLGDNNDVLRLKAIYPSVSREEHISPYGITEWRDGEKAALLLVDDLQRVLANKDFQALKKYYPEQTYYIWCACGPHDMGCNEFTFEKTAGQLKDDSAGTMIDINPEPDIYVWSGGNVYVSIETDGWATEFPFLYFNFEKGAGESHWTWRGVCDEVGPSWETKRQAGKRERIYFKKPRLPRSGPRSFHNAFNLKARLDELVRFNDLDGLKVYARHGALKFGECSKAVVASGNIPGKTTPVDDIIAYLKKRAEGTSGIRESNVRWGNMYETIGWKGDYPFVTFWMSERDKGWELSGVSYCKVNRIDLLMQNDESPILQWLKHLVFPKNEEKN